MAKAKWTFKNATMAVDSGTGTFSGSIDLLDNNVTQGKLYFQMTSNRDLLFQWQQAPLGPGVVPIDGIQAWIVGQ